MRLAGTLLLALALNAAAACAGEDPWPSLRGTAAGRATCRWPLEKPPPEIRQWHYRSKANRRYKMGLAVWASPAITLLGERPVAFIGGYDQRMHALDLAAKRVLWCKITNGAIGSPPAVGLIDELPVVFWGSSDRSVYAYFADSGGDPDGRELWTREMVKPTNTQGEAELSAPLLHDGVLYISCFVFDKALGRNQQKGWLFALKMESGRVLWQQEVSQGPVSSPVGLTVKGRFVVFVCARKGLLQAFDVSGKLPQRLWRYQMPHEVMGSPALEEGAPDPLLFLGSKFGDLHAVRARTGERVWKRMAGNWIDNSACAAELDGERHVFVGSHDYNVYALRAADGAVRWRRHLGGEVYTAPCFFHADGRPMLSVAALDNHLYVLDALDGRVVTSYYTGTPIWDKVAKGDILWGSSAVFEAEGQTAILHGSFNDFVYVYPLRGECELRTKAQSPKTLWWGLLATLALFGGVVLPIVIKLPMSEPGGGR